MKNIHYMYHIQLLPSNISMHVHANHLPTRRIFHSNLYLFLQQTVHLDLYKISLECHLLLALRTTVACQIRQGSEKVWIQLHYSHQQNLHCHEEESKPETSNHYRLHFKMNDNCVKQNTQNCGVLHEYTKQNILD